MNQDGSAREALTKREGDVLELLLEGLSSKEIARRLGISRATVRCHVQHVLTKLGVGSRAKAAALTTGAGAGAGVEAGAAAEAAGTVVVEGAGTVVVEAAADVHERAKRLTPREMQVLRCLAAGLGRSEIAERLFVSPHTARTHVQRVLSKLNVHSVLGAMALARRMGVVPLEGADG